MPVMDGFETMAPLSLMSSLPDIAVPDASAVNRPILEVSLLASMWNPPTRKMKLLFAMAGLLKAVASCGSRLPMAFAWVSSWMSSPLVSFTVALLAFSTKRRVRDVPFAVRTRTPRPSG